MNTGRKYHKYSVISEVQDNKFLKSNQATTFLLHYYLSVIVAVRILSSEYTSLTLTLTNYHQLMKHMNVVFGLGFEM